MKTTHEVTLFSEEGREYKVTLHMGRGAEGKILMAHIARQPQDPVISAFCGWPDEMNEFFLPGPVVDALVTAAEIFDVEESLTTGEMNVKEEEP